jgi:hypothetical protein
MLREFVAQLLSQFKAVWPVETRWGAKDLTYLCHLILLRLPWEERPHREQFSHDAPHCKDVDWGVVVGGTQQDLRGTIPASAYIVGERWPCIYFFRKTRFTKAEKKLLKLGTMENLLFGILQRWILTQSLRSLLSGGSRANFQVWDLCVDNCVYACMKDLRETGTWCCESFAQERVFAFHALVGRHWDLSIRRRSAACSFPDTPRTGARYLDVRA